MDKSNQTQTITGLPEQGRFRGLTWSSDGKYAAFAALHKNGWMLWVIDVELRKATLANVPVLNDVLPGRSFEWIANEPKLLIRTRAESQIATSPPQEEATQPRPVIQQSGGEVVSNRTFQDLLTSPYDADLFEYYITADLIIFDVKSKEVKNLVSGKMIWYTSASPDGKYILINLFDRPFSYQVPYYRFPQNVSVLDVTGEEVYSFEPTPLSERIPQGFGATRTGPRNWSWRNDKAATVIWLEALDGGDPRAEAEYRDAMFQLSAPFTGTAERLLKSELRFSNIRWAADGRAITNEREWRTRREVERLWNFNVKTEEGYFQRVLFDRSYEDRYSDPGNPVMTRDASGTSLLMLDKNSQILLRAGIGASPEGNIPFLDQFNLETGEVTRIWSAKNEHYERIAHVFSDEKVMVLTESPTSFPNYFIVSTKTPEASEQVTYFENPFEAMQGISREYIAYTRADGVALNGTLYLPPGYDAEKDGPLPLLMWAYPREFRDAGAAGQRNDAPHAFVRPSWASPIPFTLMGYAVFNNFSMPVIGEGDDEPNDFFVEQISNSAKAAIDTLVNMGIADRRRIAVGGHSYGAFMTANLMAHTDFFCRRHCTKRSI
jgi:dipeptidyl aminopeptidase/acylaminoacyl peptidase